MEQPGAHQALDSLKLVPFRDVLENVCQEAHAGLQALADRLPALDDQQRCVGRGVDGPRSICRLYQAPIARQAARQPPSAATRRRCRRRFVVPPAACCPLPLQQGRAAAAPADHSAAPAAPACVRAVGAQGQGGECLQGGAQGGGRPWRRLRARRWVPCTSAGRGAGAALHARPSEAEPAAGWGRCRRPLVADWMLRPLHPLLPPLPAADEFFRLHEELRFARAPLFDVSTALHILQSGATRPAAARCSSRWLQCCCTQEAAARDSRPQCLLPPLPVLCACRHLPAAARADRR